MKKFLVTGGAGFIGSHIAEGLVKKKYGVRILDNFSSGTIENLNNIIGKVDLLKGDICSKETCLKATRGIDFVLHQAALRSVPESMRRPQDYNRVNIGGTLNMLEAAARNRVRNFVFASSCAVYGDIDSFPEREDLPSRAVSVYALTKLTGEYYCKFFSRYRGLATVALRYFNVFGERQAPDDEYAAVIPKFITCMLSGRRPPVFGTGRQSRDFLYISNVVEANILAAEKLKSPGEIFNVASGRGHTILELIALLNKLLRKNIKPIFLAARPGDIFKTRADITKIKKVLGFRPQVDFISGLKSTVEYFKKNA